MKNYFFVIIIFFYFNNLSAQVKAKVDTVYYLLDTAKTPVNDRMWEVGIEELPFKHYVINCPCLTYDQKPSFIHRVNDLGEIITGKSLARLQLSNITTLIDKSKKFIENNFKGYAFYIIEPDKKKYIMHKMGLVRPIKSTPSIDIITVLPDTLKKK